MIDSIPNPLTDKGVQQDITQRVNEIMETPLRMGTLNDSMGTLNDAMRKAVTRAAQWGYAEGFHMGWLVHENREKRF